MNVASAQTCNASSGTIGSNTANICVGVTESFWSNGWGGGVWSSSNSAVLKVEQKGGNAIATGISAGTAEVIYTVKQSGCPDKVSKKTITVSNALGTTGSISGITPQCSGTTNQVYSIPSVPNATKYVWTVPSGWIITSGQNTNSITVTTSSNSGNLTVTVSNDCKTNNAEYKYVNITSNKTPTPIITASGATSFCAGNSVVLTSSLQDNYLWSNGATTRSITVTSSGNYYVKTTKKGYYCPSDASNSIPVTVSPTLLAPTVGAKTHPNCKTSTGSVVLSGLPEGNWTINPGGITGSTNSTTISGLSAGTYNFTVTNTSGCISPVSAPVVIKPFVEATNTWNGSAWSNGMPNSDQKIVFSGNYNSSGDITACSCTVTGNTKVIINSGHTLTITNEVKVVGSGPGAGSLTFENNASLVQINNAAVNSGNITYNRVTTTQVRNTDYTYWSTPVSPLKLAGVGGIAYSSLALTGSIFYSYLVTSTTEGWKSESASTPMVAGQGYGIRGPGAIATTLVGFLGVSFTGVPNNGNYSIPIAKTNASYLLGNPYPSAIDADAFLTDNSAVLDGTLYFWTHNSVIQDRNNIISTAGTGAYAYTSDDYAAYNKTGGTASALSDPLNPVGKIPTGKIAAGQGFFATSSVASGNIVFNNAMRLISNAPINNTQFFKTKNPNKKTTNIIEKHRIWLNMTNKEGAFKQTLVGYVTDATNDYDSRFDGESLDGNDFIDFYSINEDKNLVIQGRALPFDEKDEVPLGYKTTIEGDFTINIDETDGLLANQEVFLEDKLTNKTVNLKQGNYTFSTAAGTFDDRFVLKYSSKTLGVDSPQEKKDGIIALYSNADKTIIIRNNGDATIHSVSLFGMSGQNIAVWDLKNKEQTNIQLPTKELSSGIYILKMKTTTGESGKKIIVN